MHWLVRQELRIQRLKKSEAHCGMDLVNGRDSEAKMPTTFWDQQVEADQKL